MTLIDNIFTNDLTHKFSSGLLINDMSDHLPVFLLKNKKIIKNVRKVFRNIRHINIDSIDKLK